MARSRRYRILLVTNRCPPDHDGGYGLRALEIATALRERGHRVDILTSKYREYFEGARIEQPSVYRLLHYIDTSRSRNIWRYVDRIPRRIACTTVAATNAPIVREFLAGRPYDLAYCFSLERVGLATAKPILEAQIPTLWHAGDTYIADQRYAFANRYPGYRCALSVFARRSFVEEQRMRFENVAFVSEFLRRECSKRGFRPIHTYVIPRGYSAPLRHDVDRDRHSPPTFFMACRIEKNKGVLVAVRAAAILQRRRPDLDWRLEIAGASLSGHLERVVYDIRREGLADRVSILGELPHDEVLARMQDACAFLSCSTYGEPFASTIIEALANGTPLISSDAGSILEVVVPGESALVYPRYDAPMLAQHMELVVEQPALRRQLAATGVRVVEERYRLSDIIDDTEAAFAEVLKSHDQRSSPVAATRRLGEEAQSWTGQLFRAYAVTVAEAVRD